MIARLPLALGVAWLASIACSTTDPVAGTETASALAPAPVQQPSTKEPSTQEPKPGAKHWTQEELERVSREIQSDLEELRGEKFVRPVKVRVASKKELIDYLEQREDKTESPEHQAADERIAKLLAVMAPDLDLRAKEHELLEQQVGGFYDPDTDSFSLMEWLPESLTKITLAHELDHALDDQLFDIDGTLKRVGDDTDAQHAFHAVVEGSGTIVMTQWALKHRDSFDISALSEMDMQQMTSMAGAPEWMWKPLLASYLSGSGFLQKTENWMTAQTKPFENAALRKAFESPPRSTEQTLHPEKYWEADKLDEPQKIKFATDKLPEGWAVQREDTLGELLIAIVTTPADERDHLDLTNPAAVIALKATNDIAHGWGGDRIALIGKEDALVLRWVTVWDGERDAAEFYGAMTQRLPSLEKAARALGGSEPKDCDATLEYGKSNDEVIVTSRVHVTKSDLRRIVRALETTRSKSP